MNLYIDESGSMTCDVSTHKNKFFIIAVLLVDDSVKLKKIYSRFISKHLNELKQIDVDKKMFKNNKFIELKGSCLTPKLKKEFVDYFCKNNYFQILYIKIDNSKATTKLYSNKARAFNYVLKLALEYLHNKNILLDREWNLSIDERNVKTGTKYLLKEFLLTELSVGKNIVDNITVEYFDSSNNKLIQLADVFANLMYSNIVTNSTYDNEIKFMSNNNYLLNTFVFPPI